MRRVLTATIYRRRLIERRAAARGWSISLIVSRRYAARGLLMPPLQMVALVMDELDQDPRLHDLTVGPWADEASVFRQDIRYIWAISFQGRDDAVRGALLDLRDRCVGPFERFATTVDRAVRLVPPPAPPPPRRRRRWFGLRRS